MSTLKVFCITSDKYNWALVPFAYLFNKYWSTLQPVTVMGFNNPYPLPSNFRFHSIASYDYPAEQWSDALIKFLQGVQDEHFVLMLEDYWLCRTVDVRGVTACYEYMRNKPNILRFDLTDDRQYAGDKINIGAYGSYDFIETLHGSPYQMSTQAGIWNKKLLLDLLEPNKTAWEVEIHTQPPSNMRVLGTRQSPVRYANAIHKGKIDFGELAKIPQEHYPYVVSTIPKGFGSDK